MDNILNQKSAPIYIKNRFLNHLDEKPHAVILPSLIMLIKSFINRLTSKNKSKILDWQTSCSIINTSEIPEITWIGHATFLIQIGHINIITDPVFDDLNIFFRRILPPGVNILELPPIDYVLISHNHMDHLELKSLKLLDKHKNITFLVPLGLKKWFEYHKIYRVKEYSWWQQESFNQILISFLPAYHWSGRGLNDYNKSLWGSWMIQYKDRKIYFAGDTAYAGHFKCIANEFKDIDIAIMPIGPCEPRKWMKESHINAEEAGLAFLDLQAKNFIPMHWGTYNFGTDMFEDPINRISHWFLNQKLNSQKLNLIKIGQRLNFR